MTTQQIEVAEVSEEQQPETLIRIEEQRLSAEYLNAGETKRVITTIPVKKADRQWFIRVHPDPAYRMDTYMLELREEREAYLVAPDLWPELLGEIVPKTILTGINRQGVVFLWPIRLPGADGRRDAWNESALQAAELAMDTWVRVSSNMALGGYDVHQAVGDIPEPKWPEKTFEELVQVAFRHLYIDTLDHPVIRQLQGAV
mgnify:CR=1 FL=1